MNAHLGKTIIYRSESIGERLEEIPNMSMGPFLLNRGNSRSHHLYFR